MSLVPRADLAFPLSSSALSLFAGGERPSSLPSGDAISITGVAYSDRCFFFGITKYPNGGLLGIVYHFWPYLPRWREMAYPPIHLGLTHAPHAVMSGFNWPSRRGLPDQPMSRSQYRTTASAHAGIFPPTRYISPTVSPLYPQHKASPGRSCACDTGASDDRSQQICDIGRISGISAK